MTTCAPHSHIMEMFKYMTQSTALNPPVLETFDVSYKLIERRQFTDMIQLANHIVFLAQMQNDSDFPGQIQRILESWVLRGDPMPNQFIFETAELFASVGYRFRVMQWSTREQAFDELVSAANKLTLLDSVDQIFDGSRVHQDYRCFVPWTTGTYEGEFHDTNTPQAQAPAVSVYKTKLKPDHNCVGFPACHFCTKDKNYYFEHEEQHWDPHPCICDQLDQTIMAEEIDTLTCKCGKLAINDKARVMNDWEDEETGYLIRRFGVSNMATFANTSAIQLRHDLTQANMAPQLNLNTINQIEVDEQWPGPRQAVPHDDYQLAWGQR